MLELACGASASALTLAQMGRAVTAVDVSDVALELLVRAATELGLDERIDASPRDLYAYRPPTRAFALVFCRRFWDPAVFAAGCDAASVGGLVAWEAFLHDPAEGGPPIDPRYCLAPGEPASLLPTGFRLLAQSVHGEPERRWVTMLARRSAGISFATPWLAIGGAIRDEEDVRELLDAGVSHVINCQVRVDDAPLLRGRVDYLWNPAEDDREAKPAAWFLRAVEFVRQARQDPDARVLVHCTEGRARSPAIAYGVLLASGYSREDAERAVLAARPTALLRYRDDADRALGSLAGDVPPRPSRMEPVSNDEATGIGSDVVAIFQRRLAHLRTLIEDLDQEALAWRPGPDTTSISNLVLHITGSMTSGFRLQVGDSRERDRDAEFSTPPLSAVDLVGRIDAANRELEQYRDRLTLADLTEIRPRPARNQAWPGIQVLLNNFGHVMEHIAQIALTRQLYQRR